MIMGFLSLVFAAVLPVAGESDPAFSPGCFWMERVGTGPPEACKHGALTRAALGTWGLRQKDCGRVDEGLWWWQV